MRKPLPLWRTRSSLRFPDRFYIQPPVPTYHEWGPFPLSRETTIRWRNLRFAYAPLPAKVFYRAPRGASERRALRPEKLIQRTSLSAVVQRLNGLRSRFKPSLEELVEAHQSLVQDFAKLYPRQLNCFPDPCFQVAVRVREPRSVQRSLRHL